MPFAPTDGLSHASEARRLLRVCRSGALATLSKRLGGHPFATAVPYMVSHDATPVILMSRLAEHTRNLAADPRVSLLVLAPGSDVQAAARLTIAGSCRRIEDAAHVSARYVRLFPAAADLLRLDFSFYRIVPAAIRYIGGFGSIHWLTPHAFLQQNTPLSDLEDEWLARINQGGCVDLQACCRRFHAGDCMQARAVALDCDGLDVRSAAELIRIPFATPVTDAASLAAGLEQLRAACNR